MLQYIVNTKVSQGEVNTLKAHLESLKLDASDPSLSYNLSGATIVAESPAVNNSQRAEGLFDNYANPYTPGPQNSSLRNVQHQKPFVVITAPRAAAAPRCTTRGPRRNRRASRRRSANSWRSAPPQRTRRHFFATHKTSFFSRARSAMYRRVGMHAPHNTSVRCGAVSCMLYNLVSDLIRIERSPCTRAHP